MLFNSLSVIALLAPSSAIASPVGIDPSPVEFPVAARAAAAGAGATHVVVVGSLTNAKAVTFTPNTVNAAAGDVVQYQFASANHTATQAASANSPCKPASNAVNSGFMPVKQGATKIQTFSMTVQDADTPIYMYCAAANHCQQGMVMTINAAQADTQTFTKAASKAKSNVAAKKVSGGQMGTVSRKVVGKQPN